ncbi:MAG: hypothetical protein AB8U44_02410 [Aaplasma endosymbiont of Hyalomma asiaticum]
MKSGQSATIQQTHKETDEGVSRLHSDTSQAVVTAKSPATSGYSSDDGSNQSNGEQGSLSGYFSYEEESSSDHGSTSGDVNYDEVTVKVRPGSNKERLGLVSGFSFRKALYDSYNNASNLFGSQFIVDMKRCTWHVNGDTLSAQKLSDSLDAWRSSIEKFEVIRTMSEICRENYGVDEAEFLRQFSDRVCAAMALLEVMKKYGGEEDCVPSPRLVDEIVSHCHQGGFSAWTYMDIIVPLQFALDDAYFANTVSQRSKNCDDLLSSRFTSAHAIDIKKHVFVSSRDSLTVVEDLKFLVRCPDASEHVPNFVVDVGLKCKMSAKPNGVVHYTDCVAKVAIHAPPGCTIDAKPNVLFRMFPCLTEILLYIINWIKGLGLCTPQDVRAPTPTLYKVNKSVTSDGGTVVELSYSIPPVSAHPRTFFSEIMSRNNYSENAEKSREKVASQANEDLEVSSTIGSVCTEPVTSADTGKDKVR